jgi:uncharacterized lipoprotein YmbA
MRVKGIFSLTVTLLLLAGCGSTPRSNYYMLSADANGQPGRAGPAIGVGPVSVPEYLRGREMVLNRSDHKLELADYDRWAEPLDAGVNRVVAVNLAALLDTQNVQLFPWRRDAIPDYAVRIAVVQLAVHGSEARLVAEYTVARPQQGESVSQHIRNFTTGTNAADPERVAATYSQLLLELSEDIARSIRAHASEAPGT